MRQFHMGSYFSTNKTKVMQSPPGQVESSYTLHFLKELVGIAPLVSKLSHSPYIKLYQLLIYHLILTLICIVKCFYNISVAYIDDIFSAFNIRKTWVIVVLVKCLKLCENVKAILGCSEFQFIAYMII